MVRPLHTPVRRLVTELLREPESTATARIVEEAHPTGDEAEKIPFSRLRVSIFVLAPIVVGVTMVATIGRVGAESATELATFLAFLSGVVTVVLPLLFAIADRAAESYQRDPENGDRVTALDVVDVASRFAVICLSTIYVVAVSIGVAVGIASKLWVPANEVLCTWLHRGASFVLYCGVAAVAILVLSLADGVYTLLTHHLSRLRESISGRDA